MPIPRELFQIWYQGLPEEAADPVREKLEATRRLCQESGFGYTLEDDASIRRQLTAEQVEVYEAYHRLHQRVDFAKICLMLRNGGVYLDADAELLKPLDSRGSPLDFTSDRLYVSQQHPSMRSMLKMATFANNGFYAAPRDHCVLRGYAQRLAQLQATMGGGGDVDSTTGPFTLSTYLQELGPREDVVLLPWHFMEACVGGICAPTSDTLSLHRHRLSWLSPGQRRLARVMGAAVLHRRALLALLLLSVAALLKYFFFDRRHHQSASRCQQACKISAS